MFDSENGKPFIVDTSMTRRSAVLALSSAAVMAGLPTAAVAARVLAPDFGIDPERAYALGLLHTVPYADLLPVVEEMKVDPGPFRAAMIDAYRPLIGRRRADGWSLPSDFEAVIADDGTDPRAAAALVRAARAALPDCALGSLPPRVASPHSAREIALEANRLFEFLGLPPARVP